MAIVKNIGRLGISGFDFGTGVIGTGRGGEQLFALNLDSATAFFREITVVKENVLMNELGLYSIAPIGRDLQLKTQKLTTPRHLLQARTNCNVWNPKGKATLIPKNVPTYAYEYDGEQCADAFFGDCMEKLLAPGVKVWELLATEEGRILMGQLIDSIYDSLQNDFYDVTNFSQDNFAEQSNAGGWWQTTGEETQQNWDEFYEQQFDHPLLGFIPQIEILKVGGAANFNVAISPADVNGATYTGDPTELFERMFSASKAKFRQVLTGRGGRKITSVFLVSPSIFRAYYSYLIATYTAIPEGLRYLLDGTINRGILMYDGIPVVQVDEWGMYDNTVGITTHRAVLTALGNFVVGHNIEAPNYMDGYGFIAKQRPELSAKGKWEFHTTFRVGTDIAEPDFMVNASLVRDPDGNTLTYTP